MLAYMKGYSPNKERGLLGGLINPCNSLGRGGAHGRGEAMHRPRTGVESPCGRLSGTRHPEAMAGACARFISLHAVSHC